MSHQDMGFEDMEFPGVSKSMWNFQGLIKNKVVEFPDQENFQQSTGVWFLFCGIRISPNENLIKICGVSRGGAFFCLKLQGVK